MFQNGDQPPSWILQYIIFDPFRSVGCPDEAMVKIWLKLGKTIHNKVIHPFSVVQHGGHLEFQNSISDDTAYCGCKVDDSY